MKQEKLIEESEDIYFYQATGEYGFLSNLYKVPVEFEGKVFPSAEHAYQYGKPRKKEVAEWLISAPKPHLVAAAAHSLLSFDIVSDWQKIKVERMRQVLVAKFTQNRDLCRKLIYTGGRRLFENSKMDAFWGIGKKGNGKNMLGFLLMQFRANVEEF